MFRLVQGDVLANGMISVNLDLVSFAGPNVGTLYSFIYEQPFTIEAKMTLGCSECGEDAFHPDRGRLGSPSICTTGHEPRRPDHRPSPSRANTRALNRLASCFGFW